jgi:hypothetical protein
MISPQFTMAVAQARIDDFRRAADRFRVAYGQTRPPTPVLSHESVTLRFGSPGDEKSLAELAALDSAERPTRPVLLAEVDGRLRAAMTLSDGTVIADPFHATTDVIDLLCARARQVCGRRWLRGCRQVRA